MKESTRWIGLSLGADIDWPICFEEILRRLDLCIPWEGERVRLACERVTIEPFDLAQGCRYDVVVDRLTHWYHTSREWIKKAVIMNGLYVFNNPWAVQSMEKQTTYCAMMHLGMRVPTTWLIPPKAYDDYPDLAPTLQRYARLFDLAEVGRRVGYPLYMKPYDGGGWRAVTRIENEEELKAAYERSGKLVMHLQRAVEPAEMFVRCLGVGPDVRVIRYDPAAPLHDRYTAARGFLPDEERERLEEITLTINAFFGWDFNSCEAIRSQGIWHPFDFANACPDAQVTSLGWHFPWLVKAKLRWAIFCAVTKRPMRRTLDWDPFYAIRERGLPFRERLRAYAAVARERLEAERFAEFCATHLSHLDEVAWEFFGSDVARDAVRQKVEALYPPHEVAEFTDLFWGRIQAWREWFRAGEEGA